MTSPDSQHRFHDGPYVRIATICERALQESDGVLSLIRVVDRLTHTAAGTDAPADMPPVTFSLTLVVMLTSGQARGSYDILLRLELPSGLSRDLASQRLLFEGEDRGVNIVAPSQLTFESPGLYWIQVLLDSVLMTKVPLRVE